MAGLLSPGTPFYRAWSSAADLVLVNVVTLVACAPLVTAGAALTACARVTAEMAPDEEGYVLRTWWRSFRGNLVQSLAWWLPVLLLAGTGAAAYVLAGSGAAGAGTSGAVSGLVLAGSALVAGVLVWLVPLVALFENTVAGHVANAVRLAIGRLELTVVALAVLAAPLVLVVVLPGSRAAVGWFEVLLGSAFAGYLIALLQRGVMGGLLHSAA